MTRESLISKLASAMGGKAAEELIFGAENVTNGASSDIAHVTNLATAMVSQWGMSDKLGNINYTATQESFMGSQSHFNASDESREIIDQEVRRLVDEAYATATGTLVKHRDQLEALAKGLLEYETLSGDDMKLVIRGEPPKTKDDEDDTPDPGDAASVTAIPKTKPKTKRKSHPDGGMEPEPTA
jgi:cell division protease FtsH